MSGLVDKGRRVDVIWLDFSRVFEIVFIRLSKPIRVHREADWKPYSRAKKMVIGGRKLSWKSQTAMYSRNRYWVQLFLTQGHRIIDWFVFEKTFQDHLFQLPYHWKDLLYYIMPKVMSIQPQSSSNDRAWTCSLGTLSYHPSKSFPSYVQSKSIHIHFQTFSPCTLPGKKVLFYLSYKPPLRVTMHQ